MQFDGHHAGTYVTARLAGFGHGEAETISYAAQYVDDATNDGAIQFSDSAYLYARIASAHSMIDYNNLVQVKNHLAWIPFHFLPGNGLLPSDVSPDGGEMGKLICRPDSPIARDMLRAAFRDHDKPRRLHRLGIAMHVYADTFAHQGFIGALSEGNRVENVTSGNSETDKKIRDASEKEFWDGVWTKTKAFAQFLSLFSQIAFRERKSLVSFYREFRNKRPLGHAAVDTFPDQPYLVWSYMDWTGTLVKRDNPATFMQAFNMMVKAMQAWQAGDASMDLEAHPGMSAADATVMEKLVRELTDPVAEVRHEQWRAAIAQGAFSFGSENLRYIPKGMGSWKEAALGTVKKEDTGFERYGYSPEFLDSNWKRFHDALQAHRSNVVNDILPRYEICAA